MLVRVCQHFMGDAYVSAIYVMSKCQHFMGDSCLSALYGLWEAVINGVSMAVVGIASLLVKIATTVL